MKMNSKERVLCTIRGETPDRVPMDFGANKATLQKLYKYYNTSGHINHNTSGHINHNTSGHINYNTSRHTDYNASGHMELLKKLNVDIFDMRGIVDPIYKGPVPHNFVYENGVKQNFWGIRTKIMQTATGPEECHCDFILKGVDCLNELEKYPWPKADWFDFTKLKDELKLWSDFAVMAAHGSFFQAPQYLKSLEDFLVDMIVNPEVIEYIMDRFSEFYLEFYERIFISAPGMISIIRLAEDIGMQDRTLVSTEIFDSLIAPRIRKFADLAHSYGAKLMFHSCGSIIPFIDRLIGLGVDILDPIQTRAVNMDPVRIKNEYGSRICLHGSVDTQYTLPKGSVQEVEDEVKERIEVLGKGGRFILAPCHVLQTDVPEENITAMYNAGYKYGFYRE